MYAWNQRPGSKSHSRSGSWFLLGAIPWFVLLLSATGVLARDPLLPVIELNKSGPICKECKILLQEDRSWLKGLSGDERAFVVLPGYTSGLPDSMVSDGTALVDLLAEVMEKQSAAELPERPLVAKVRDRWLAKGFLQAKVQWSRGQEDQPDTLLVTPGAVWTLAKIDLGGPDFPERDKLLKNWLPPAGTRFSVSNLQLAIAGILEFLGESGYPFPRWVTRNVYLNPGLHTVGIQASLLPGQRSRVGPVTCDLAPGPAVGFLVRASGLRAGEYFSSSALDNAVDRLRARNLYVQVGVPRVYLTQSPDSVGIYFPVKPRAKVNRLQVVLGFNRSSTQGPSRLSGQVDLDMPNMAGTGRKLNAAWRDDGAGTSQFSFGYQEPLILGSPLDVNTAMSSEVRQDVFTRFTWQTNIELPLVALWGVGLGLGLDRSTYPEGSLERTSRRLASGAVSHKRGDLRQSGWDGRFEVAGAWGSTNTRLSPTDSSGISQLGQSTAVRIYQVDLGAELWLGSSISIAGHTSYREQTGGEEVVPLAEQFWFGGANTLRGYNEREFHGSRVAYGSLELRLGSSNSSRLYTFWDLGYFSFASKGSTEPELVSTTRGYPRGFGLGLMARTRGGDLSLAIGFPGTVDFGFAKLHVSLLESF